MIELPNSSSKGSSQVDGMSRTVKLVEPEQSRGLDEAVRANALEFLRLLALHPLRTHRIEYVSLSESFWLWWLAKVLQPRTVIESGTMDGWSAWWLFQGMPDGSLLLTHDPAGPPFNVMRGAVPGRGTRRWVHWQTDFAEDLTIREEPVLAFFDDHVDQPLRVQQAIGRGIKHLVFHDVYPTPNGGHRSLWAGIPDGSWVLQFPRISEPEPFGAPARSCHAWLTYLLLP